MNSSVHAYMLLMVVLLVLEIAGSLIWIVGTPPPRSKTVLAWTVVANMALSLWGVVLIALYY